MPFDDALLPSAVNNCQEEKSNTNGAVLSGRSWRARQVSIAWHALDGMGDSAARALPDRLRCASVNGLNQGGGHGPRRRQSGVRRGRVPGMRDSALRMSRGLAAWRQQSFQIDVGVRMKSVSRAAQGRAGRPVVGVPVSSATGGKAGPMRVAACALAITAAIAASPAHAQYYSVDDGGTPGGIARITARPAPAPGRRDGCDLERACGDGGGIQRAGIGRLHHRHRRACAGDWRE